MTNPGLGFYSRHLTEDDVQVISANTRKLIFNNGQVRIGISAYHKFIYNSMLILMHRSRLMPLVITRTMIQTWSRLRTFSIGCFCVATMKTSSKISLNISTLHSWLVFKRFHWLNKLSKSFQFINNCNPQTCQSWAQFIDSNLWSNPRTLERIRSYWATFMPKCFVIAHNRPIISLACTPA